MTLTSGDVVDVDFGAPAGREAGARHPAIVVTAQRILDADPSVVHVVPLTSRRRGFHSEVDLEPDSVNGLRAPSAAQCHHLRAIATPRILGVRGNAGVAVLAQIRETVSVLLDLP